MSKESDQTLTMLFAVSGSMKWLQIEKAYAKVAMKEAIQNVEIAVQDVVRDWPRFFNKKWAMTRWLEFAEEIDSPSRTENYEAIEMVLICDRIMADLQDIYQFGRQKELINRIVPHIKVLTNHADPEGNHFVAYDRVRDLM